MGVGLALLVACGLGCGDDDSPGSAGDGGDNTDSGALLRCESDSDCDDGVFCNGIERCRPSDTTASAEGCVRGAAPQCNDNITCTTDVCSHSQNRCLFVPPDADGDGHADAQCLGPDGEPLGDDCDDTDPFRFPGNPEVCSPDDPEHDEDCDPTTFGWRDLDGDGAHDDTCCNVADDDTRTCGTDCDDTDPRVRDGYPELCDLIDNDCNGIVDDNTVEVPWYSDADGDSYGDPDSTPITSCAVVLGRSVLDTDCDDTHSARHPAAREICNGIDDDCDGAIDEGDACRCGNPGLVQPCVCSDNRSGFHLCLSDGRWDQCDCRECVDGTVDCLGGLIPRACVGGRWVASTACSGVTPVCTLGACVCLDGTTECTAIEDVVPPFVQALIPGDLVSSVTTTTVVSVVLSEPIASSSVNPSTFHLRDVDNTEIEVTHHTQGNTISLVPTTPLHPGRSYRVHVEGITDLAGNALPMARTWTFLTALDTDVEILSALDPVPPVQLTTHPNGIALLTVDRQSPFVSGQYLWQFEGGVRSPGRTYAVQGLCVGLCIAAGSLWTISPTGELVVYSAATNLLATGPNHDALTDLANLPSAPTRLRAPNETLIVAEFSSPLALNYRVGDTTTSVTYTGSFSLAPVVSVNGRGDVLAARVRAMDGTSIRVSYGRGTLPSTTLDLQAATTDLRNLAGTLSQSGTGLVAWVEAESWAVGGGPSGTNYAAAVARVSDVGALGPRVPVPGASTSDEPMESFQVVAAGELFWVVYRAGNQVRAFAVDTDGFGAGVTVSDGPRVHGTIGDVVASGAADGTLTVTWIENGVGFGSIDAVVSARRLAPDGTLTPIETLVAARQLAHLRSGNQGPSTTLTAVLGGTGVTPDTLYAIRH